MNQVRSVIKAAQERQKKQVDKRRREVLCCFCLGLLDALTDPLKSRNYHKEVGMVEFQGLLKVRVIKGTYLAIRDVKTSDPYVVVRIGHQTMKTRVINSNLNPIWNEELMLSVPSPPPPLKVQVFDKDLLSADDSMGEAEVDLQPLVSAASLHEGITTKNRLQVGKWLATNDNALVEDSLIWLKEDGHVTQGISLRLQNVESGLLDLDLEWVPLNQ
ncbi:hypothetical protein L7F22_029339 [Adiantum nelumboides]|nr:hypothetical protein [Adiantum nelumboides]